MRILRNGQYVDEDISNDPAYKTITRSEKEVYPQYIGVTIGDFEVLKVEYDYGKRDQRWTVKCGRCGDIRELYHTSDWRRGKGASTRCSKCLSFEKIQKNASKEKATQEYRAKKKEKEQLFESLIANKTEINGMFAVEKDASGRFLCQCVECGNRRRISRPCFADGRFDRCVHKKANTYGDEVIDQKYGHLTAVERVGKYFSFRCDCGFEKVLRPTDVCRGMITTCGRPECEYYKRQGFNREFVAAIEEGFAFEKRFAETFKNAGYDVVRTPNSGDYGVDVIVKIRGERWAFQCKKKKTPTTSKAVMEVYAGGRFYDCTRFCVASPSGFTDSARKMAAKLGVQLETNAFHFGVTREENAIELLSTVECVSDNVGKRKKTWTINGVRKTREEWCKEYGVSLSGVKHRLEKGMSVEEALSAQSVRHLPNTEFAINGETRKLREWCNEYGVMWPTFCYRVKQRKMSYLEALTTPVMQSKRET